MKKKNKMKNKKINKKSVNLFKLIYSKSLYRKFINLKRNPLKRVKNILANKCCLQKFSKSFVRNQSKKINCKPLNDLQFYIFTTKDKKLWQKKEQTQNLQSDSKFDKKNNKTCE